MDNPHKWPPLNCLRGFQYAAQLGSFSKAAQTLHVTQSAISHQVKTLEEWLGQPLFIRVNRRVVLTDAGKDLLVTTGECLDVLDDGFKRLEQYKKTNQIILQTQTAFASNWLLPRLSEYREFNKEINVWLYTTDDHSNIDLSEVHLGVLYGEGDWPNLSSLKLLDDVLIPICRPDHPVLSKFDRKPEDLPEYDLLHSELNKNWNHWYASMGLPEINPVEGPSFSNQGLLQQATEHGQGIALGSLILAAEALRTGKLVSPINHGIETSKSYYLVSREGGLKNHLLEPFTAWLVDQATAFKERQLSDLLEAYDINS